MWRQEGALTHSRSGQRLDSEKKEALSAAVNQVADSQDLFIPDISVFQWPYSGQLCAGHRDDGHLFTAHTACLGYFSNLLDHLFIWP